MEIADIIRDFQRRYGESFVWVVPPNSDEESLFHVDSITPDRKNIAILSLSSPEYGKIILNYGTSHMLRFKQPPVGVYQNGPDAYIFRRSPARQWKHGICATNSSVLPVFHRIVPDTISHQVHRFNTITFDDVLAAFQGVQYNYADAVQMLGSGKYRSVALRSNFSVCLAPDTEAKSYILLFLETPVARVDSAGKLTLLIEKQYEIAVQRLMEN
jgi:hypothetical protein